MYEPFTAHHFVESLQLLLGTALGFWLLRAKLGGEPTTTRDVDVLYRGPLSWVLNGATIEAAGRGVGRLSGSAIDGAWTRVHGYVTRIDTPPFSVQSTVTISVIAGGAWLLLWLLQ